MLYNTILESFKNLSYKQSSYRYRITVSLAILEEISSPFLDYVQGKISQSDTLKALLAMLEGKEKLLSLRAIIELAKHGKLV